MTLNQFAAWLHTIVADEATYIEDYDPEHTTYIDGDINFKNLALRIAEKLGYPLAEAPTP